MDKKNLNHRSLPKDDTYDEIRMKIVPRYKTSGLSGDEWRTSVRIDFYFKGEIIKTTSTSNMQYAMLFLGGQYSQEFDDK